MSMMVSSQLTLSTKAFEPGGRIPEKYTCDGADVSPQLSWSGMPEGTESFTLIMDDPDAPGGTFTHWVVYNLPPSTTELDEGIAFDKIVEKGASQSKNSANSIGYMGPCPPPGKPHHYHFKLYALDTLLDVPSLMPKKAIEEAMKGHILAQAEIIGLYKRKK